MVARSKKEKALNELEKLSVRITNSIGTPVSVLMHTALFIGSLSLVLFGFSLEQVLLILTTWVSLEAIYLSIFIQMTVNRNTRSLEEVEEDIEEIQEDVEGLEDDVEEISEEIDDIAAEDVKDDMKEEEAKITLKNIEDDLDKLMTDIASLKANMPQKQSSKKYLNG